jgi:Leucine-rich repeat (LRR) protein
MEAPVTLVDSSGVEHTPRRWADVPPRYREIRHIDLSGGAVRNEELEMFARLDTLQSLSLSGTAVDDEGLVQLAELKALKRLDLSKTAVGDKGLARLKNLSQLRDLDLRGTKVTDAGLEALTGLPLESLRLSNTMVGDAGIEKLAAVQTLKSLSVDGTRVTDEGYRALGKAFAANPIDKNDLDAELSLARKLLRGGATISIVPEVASADKIPPISDVEDLPREKFFITGIDAAGSAEVDDDLVPQFKMLTRLTDLDLDGSAVTEKGLAHLKQIPTLRTVQLGYLRVAAESVQSLKVALSDAEVKWEGPRDRAAAQWVIAQGGSVRISKSLSDLSASKLTRELPANRDFRLLEIHLVKPLEMAAADWSAIKDLGDLKLLNLTGANVSESILDGMTGCKNVQTLALKGSQVTSAAVALLPERFPALENLYLADSAIDGASLHLLKKLQSLRQLSLAGTKLMDADLAALAALPTLQWLSLDGVPLQDGAVEHLKALKQLKTLSLDDEQIASGEQMMPDEALPEPGQRSTLRITDAGLEELKSSLKGVQIYSRTLDPERLAARWILEQGGTLVAGTPSGEEKIDKAGALPRQACKILEVSLKNARATPDLILAKLRECQNLRSLDLSGNTGLTDKHLAQISGFSSLESLNLAKTGVTDAAFEKLGSLPNLKTLGLQGTLVSGAGLEKHPLPKLTRLYAGTTDFNDRTLAALKDCPDLQVLDLNNCKGVTDRGLAELGGLTNLQRLDLSLTRIGDSSTALGKLLALKQINLYGTNVGDATVQQLKGMDQLEEANLAKTKVTDSAMASLGAIKSLRRLSIYSTSVTDNAARPLRDRGVEVNKSDDPVQRDPNGGGAGFGFGSL